MAASLGSVESSLCAMSSPTKRRRFPGALVVVCVLALVVLAGFAVGYKLMNSRQFMLFGEMTNRVETDEKVVALTFDDGPSCADLDAVLDAMGDVRGTFFLNGRPMSECPDGAEQLLAAGHELGNHTQTHRAIVFLTPSEVEDEILPTDQALREAGVEGEILFRPPYGKKLLVLPWWLAEHDRHTAMWDVSAETWTDTPQTAQEIADLTLAAVAPGSIILLHPWDGRTQTQEAIPLIIDGLPHGATASPR